MSVMLVYCGQTVGQIKLPLRAEVGGTPRPRPHCVRWGPSSLTERSKAQQPPIFGPLCSGTVAHLSCCWALVFFFCQISYIRWINILCG